MHESTLRIILVLIVLLPFGSTGDSLLLSSIYVFLCLIVSTYSFAIHWHSHHYFATTILLPPLLMICLYLLLQIMPLPPDLINVLSSTTGKAYQETIWVAQPGAWMPLAIHAEETIRAFLFVVAVGTLCLAISQFMIDLGHFAKILQYIVFAIASWAASSITMTIAVLVLAPHLQPWQETIMVTRDSLNMWSVCLVPILMAGHAIHKSKATHLSIIEQVKRFLRTPSGTPHTYECLTFILVVASIFISQSWQNVLLLVFAWAVFNSFTLPRIKSGQRLSRFWWIGVSGFCLVGLNLLSGGFSWIPSHDYSRLRPYDSSWFYTWFGCGLGGQDDLLPTTGDVFCRTSGFSSLGGAMDLWVGMGAFGATLLVVMALMIMCYAGKGKWGQTRTVSHKLVSGGITSIILLLLSGLYSSHLNWEAIFSGCCLALLVMLLPRLCQEAAGHGYNDKLYHRAVSSCLCVLTASSLVFSAFFYAGIHRLEGISKQFTAMHSNGLNANQLTRFHKSINAEQNLFTLAKNDYLQIFKGYLEYYQMDSEKAIASFEQALKNRPLNPQIIMALAGTYGWLDRSSKAESLIDSRAINNYRPDLFLERMLTRMFNKKISETGLKIVQKTFALCPEFAGKGLNLLYVNGWGHDDIQNFLTTDSSVWFGFGDMLYAQGEIEKAEEAYLKAAAMKANDRPGSEETFNHVVNHFVSSDQLVKALIVAESGVDSFPENGQMRRRVADIHSRLGNTNKATQGYDQANALDRKAR